MNNTLILIFIVIVFIFGGLLYIYNPEPVEYTNPAEIEPVACTMDAKLCPDGSYVGRVAPDCEFEACPTYADENKVMPPDAIFEDGTIFESDLP